MTEMQGQGEFRVAVVTGGGRGIGKAICAGLAKEGYKVALVSQSERSCNSAAEEINADFPDSCKPYSVNVADFAKVQELGKEILSEFGKVDVLVNNAGITRDGLFLRMSESDWDEVLAVNLKGAFNMTKAVQRSLLKQKNSRIINITSTVGLSGNAGQVNYSASKAGIIGFTKSLARELSGRNVTVNAIAPGFISTDMTEVLSDKIKDEVKKIIPLKRFGRPEDIGRCVSFLADENNGYITGQIICIDGGMCM